MFLYLQTKDREVDFDVEVAISVCRQTSAEDALLLAEKHRLHSWYLKIQIEDNAKYITACEYIGNLPFIDASVLPILILCVYIVNVTFILLCFGTFSQVKPNLVFCNLI